MKARRCPHCSDLVMPQVRGDVPVVVCDRCQIVWIGVTLGSWPMLTRREVIRDHRAAWGRVAAAFQSKAA